MSYYYLDSDKKPQGPYTSEDLNSLKACGVIHDDTLAAAAGDSNWRPLSEVLVSADCSTWNNEIQCPHCEKEIEEKSVPNKCPHCTKWIHGNDLGLWGAFVHGMKNFTNFKGRATRTEFWGFFLFSTIIKMGCNKMTEFITLKESALFKKMLEEKENEAHFFTYIKEYLCSTPVLTAMSIDFIIWIILFIPFLAVSVRRLHDTGRTATSVVLGTCSLIMVYISGAAFVWQISNVENFGQAVENLPLEEYVSSVFILGASSVFYILISIYLFIMMLLPSNPGSNKFGPCAFLKKI